MSSRISGELNEILQKEEEAKKRIQEFENNSLEKISNALNTKIEASKEIMNNTILAEHLNTMEELGNHALGLTSESKQVIESTANIAQARITGSIANLNERITTELDNKKKSSMKDKVVFGMLGVIIALLGLVLFNSSNISTTSSQNTQNQGYTRSLNTQAQ